MVLTKETVAKVLAQYAGQKVFKHGEHPVCIMWRMAPWQLAEVKLLLKPLTALTDEDLKKCRCYLGDGMSVTDLGNLFCNLYREKNTRPIYLLQDFQLLQSLGYDLPNVLLDGNTLHDCGLAIYEPELLKT